MNLNLSTNSFASPVCDETDGSPMSGPSASGRARAYWVSSQRPKSASVRSDHALQDIVRESVCANAEFSEYVRIKARNERRNRRRMMAAKVKAEAKEVPLGNFRCCRNDVLGTMLSAPPGHDRTHYRAGLLWRGQRRLVAVAFTADLVEGESGTKVGFIASAAN